MNIHSNGSLNIVNALIFDGTSADLRQSSIQIEGGIIVSIGAINEALPTLDVGGRFVMPGLIDAHFHAYGISLDGYYNDTAPQLSGARWCKEACRGAIARFYECP